MSHIRLTLNAPLFLSFNPLSTAIPSTAAMGYTLLIDNYDSFTWNIYADIATLGGNPLVRRNDQISLSDIERMYTSGDLDRVVISPGPGHPQTDSGISRDVITWAMGKVPVLGVCMGLECLVDVLGGEVSAGVVRVWLERRGRRQSNANGRLPSLARSSTARPLSFSTTTSAASMTSPLFSLQRDTIRSRPMSFPSPRTYR